LETPAILGVDREGFPPRIAGVSKTAAAGAALNPTRAEPTAKDL
jgi:hypothetical protein